MSKKAFYEIWVRKKDSKGRLAQFSFVRAFTHKKWQFALKLKKKMLDRGFQVLLRTLEVTNEEKSGQV